MSTSFKVKQKGKAYYVYGYHDGNRAAKKIGSCKAAQRFAEKMYLTVKGGDLSFFEKGIPSFKTMAEKMLAVKDPDSDKGSKEDKVRRSSMQRYMTVLRTRILPVIGKIPVTKIESHHIGEILTKAKDDGVSASTKTIIHSLLVDTCGRAYLTVGDVKVNIAREVIANGDPGKVKRNKDKGNPLTQQQMGEFLSAAEIVAPKHFALFAVMLMTGMRLGECLALTWGDVDFERQLINIDKSWRRELTEPKSRSGIRQAEFPKTLSPILKEHQLRMGRIFKADELIFGSTPTKHASQNTVRRKFKKVIKRAGISDRRLHDLRHTYGTIQANRPDGPPLIWLKNQMGHSSISITELYVKKVVSKDRTVADGFGDLVNLSNERK